MRRSDFHSQGYAGFHKIPQQHLFGISSPAVRPSYNTMDFTRDDSAPENASTGHVLETKKSSKQAQEAKKDKKKQKKKNRLSTNSVDPANYGATIGVDAIEEAAHVFNAFAADRQERKDEKRKKRHSEKSESKSQKDGKISEKKRKRKSEPQPESPSGSSEGHIATPIIDLSGPHDFKSATSKNGDVLDQSHDASDKPSKKKIKSHRKITELNASLSQDSVVSVSTPVDNLVKKSKKAEDLRFANTLARDHLQPQPPAPTATVSPYITTPKKTPIPLPQKSTSLRTTAPASSQVNPPAQDAEILVVETPPSKLTSASSKVWKTPVRAMQTHVPVPTVTKLTRDNFKLSKSAPKTTLNDEANSQRYRRSGSVSSASSMSIKDAFLRVRKSSFVSSDDIDDPFNVPKSLGKTSGYQGEKATFDAALLTFRSTVDFTKEKEYYKKFMEKRIEDQAAGPLPCLHQATGCQPSKERALALGRPDTSNLLTVADRHTSSHNTVNRAVAAYLSAEKFLSNAVLTSMPVPSGTIEGVYSLYCPKYTDRHVDKYSAGQRTLTISRPSGFKSNTFTARLVLPPRPMAFNVRAFRVPVHASFLAIELLTSDEAYSLELAVLGNGYISLRMDLGLLLTGRRSERAGGGKGGDGVVMEFYGVKEKDGKGNGAVEWNTVEEKIRKKYEAERVKKETGKGAGVMRKVEVSTGVEDTPTPKKRGRPSKADLERRAMEREKEIAARGGF